MASEGSEASGISKAEFDCFLDMMMGLQDQMSSMKRELSEERGV